ncbi:hypothetical protein E2562_005960 [Oryza meyeriana var. granulata]|uniref:TF-B3 domain-containing protein n=1 Tax=Oryza meyeriana var. granulata TaxID=110450 RepID=A0A6G1DU45_9ORYZ|nr:hypothetical protein E2562_005960 [Oryza meyeriana var. granulata]
MVGIDLNTVEEEEGGTGTGGGCGVPQAVARLRRPRCAAAKEGQCRRVPAAGPPRAPWGHARRRCHRHGAAARFCRVVDVSLHADSATDEVYAQVSLVADNERRGGCDGEGEDVVKRPAWIPHMFCKTLTASDTSTHSGFSVPRRVTEDCFPPLDYGLQRPSQELAAKDLHGTEWRFRHIYRGDPPV